MEDLPTMWNEVAQLRHQVEAAQAQANIKELKKATSAATNVTPVPGDRADVALVRASEAERIRGLLRTAVARLGAADCPTCGANGERRSHVRGCPWLALVAEAAKV